MCTTREGSLRNAVRRLFSIRVRLALRNIGLWLDARSLRAYSQDMHSWSAKMETLRALKSSLPQPAWTREPHTFGCVAPKAASALPGRTMSIAA
jgi:hypothetical protein